MKFIEYEAKALFRRHGISVPKSRFVPEIQGAVGDWGGDVAVKAQVLFGGRGKQGLVQLGRATDLPSMVADVRTRLSNRNLPPLILIEEKVEAKAEYYLAIRIDDIAQEPVLLFSLKGGIGVEDDPDSIQTFPLPTAGVVMPYQLLPFFLASGVPGKLVGALARLSAQLLALFRAEDAELVEINPLCPVSDRDLIALDGKISTDDSAAFRHDWQSTHSWSLRHSELTPLERHAASQGFTYIELDGNIAVLTGGAGLGMLTLDAILQTGHRPANFIDTVGGSTTETFRKQVDTILDRAEAPQIDAIVAFFTVTATSLASVVGAIVSAVKDRAAAKPMFVGFLAGGAAEAEMDMEEASRVMREAGIVPVRELADLMQVLTERVPLR